jgi:hypothetical protein
MPQMAREVDYNLTIKKAISFIEKELVNLVIMQKQAIIQVKHLA